MKYLISQKHEFKKIKSLHTRITSIPVDKTEKMWCLRIFIFNIIFSFLNSKHKKIIWLKITETKCFIKPRPFWEDFY